MGEFGQDFVQETKVKLDIELIGVASVATSPSRELKERATTLLPNVQSVIVFGKEIFKEVVSLLKPSKEAGEAEAGELLGGHTDYLNGRLNRAIHELANFLTAYDVPEYREAATRCGAICFRSFAPDNFYSN